MKRGLKIAALMVLTSVILVILLTVALNLFLKPQFVRDKIINKVSQQIHRDLEIKGDATWSLFPRIKVHVGNVSLGNPEGFSTSTEAFAEVKQLDLGLSLFSLLMGEVQVNHLALNGLRLHLLVNNQGLNNWTFSLPGKTKEKNNVEASHKASPLNLNIASVVLNDAQITYDNALQKQKMGINHLNVSANNINQKTPFDFEMSSDVDLGQGYTGSMQLVTEMLLDPQWKQVQLGHMKYQAQVQLPNRQPLKLNVTGSVWVDLEKGHLSLTEFDCRADAVHLVGEIESNYQDAKQPLVLAKLTISSFDPRKFFAILNQPFPAFQNTNALNKLSGKFTVQATENAVQVNDLQIIMDDSTLTGTLGVSDFNKKQFQFALNLDQIDLNLYKINDSAAPDVNHQASAPKAAQAGAPPALKQWGGVGNINLGILKVGNTVLSNTTATLAASQGVYSVNPIKTHFYQGSYIGQLIFNAPAASFNLKGALTGVDAKSLLNALRPITGIQLSGTADINENLNTQGVSMDALMRNLNGHILFAFNNGVIEGIDLSYYYALGKALLAGQTSTSVENTQQTQFGNLTGSVDVTQGVANNHDLLLQGPVLQAKGSGQADLVNQRVDYQLIVTSSMLGSHNLPVKITGPFSRVSIMPDIQKIAQDELKAQAIKAAKKQLQGKVGDLIQQKVGQAAKDTIVKGLGDLLQSPQ